MTWLNLSFPNLRNEGFTVIEPPSDRYNCVAYTAGDTSRWWDHTPRRYWPPHASRSGRIESLIEVFVVLGYEQCKDESLEDATKRLPSMTITAPGSTRAFKCPTEHGAAKWAKDQ